MYNLFNTGNEMKQQEPSKTEETTMTSQIDQSEQQQPTESELQEILNYFTFYECVDDKDVGAESENVTAENSGIENCNPETFTSG